MVQRLSYGGGSTVASYGVPSWATAASADCRGLGLPRGKNCRDASTCCCRPESPTYPSFVSAERFRFLVDAHVTFAREVDRCSRAFSFIKPRTSSISVLQSVSAFLLNARVALFGLWMRPCLVFWENLAHPRGKRFDPVWHCALCQCTLTRPTVVRSPPVDAAVFTAIRQMLCREP